MNCPFSKHLAVARCLDINVASLKEINREDIILNERKESSGTLADPSHSFRMTISPDSLYKMTLALMPPTLHR